MNTMSTKIRKYELKARAESQRETRDRIARVTAELHEEKGVAHTTVAEIARRAGVTRLTVYNHFAGLSELLPACAAHYEQLHPAPDFAGVLAQEDDAGERVRAVLGSVYGWYRETEPMYGKLFSDRASVPELDRFLEQNIDRMLDGLGSDLAAGFAVRGRAADRLRALTRLALDFWTWRRLAGEGLDDEIAADLMAGAVASTVT
jgi:AcrR family transcriptional regulator